MHKLTVVYESYIFLKSKKLNDILLLPAKFYGNILVNIGIRGGLRPKQKNASLDQRVIYAKIDPQKQNFHNFI